MKEEIELYLKRAKKFEENAKFNFERKDYDIAMFHIEQAMQLIIKAKLLDEKGYFERTHSLRKLLHELKNDEVKKFVEKYEKVLRDLERAYITSRYYFEEFFEDEVLRAFEALREIRAILWKE
ncbi:MAG: HEPN domain-containing protein [Archaeoglobaceae archaeon]|nr:HEPN domain-containing protein [Archaeoglobales archaeon]